MSLENQVQALLEQQARMAAQLDELQSKQDIREALVRMTRGFDRLDEELVASAFHTDAIYDHWVFSEPMRGAADIAKTLVEFLRNDPVYMWVPHFIMQSAIKVEGDVAFSEDHALTCRRTRQPPDLVFCRALRLLHRWERRDDKVWRVAYRTAMVDNFEMGGPAAQFNYPEKAKGMQSRRDVTYHWHEALQPGKPYTWK